MKKLLVCMFAILLLAGCAAQEATPTTVPENTESIPEETTMVTEEVTTEETIAPVEGVDGEPLYNEDRFALVFQGVSEAQLPENATKKQKSEFKEGQVLTFTAVNKTEMTVYMRLMNLSVNSFMMETLPMVPLEPGEHRQVQYTLTTEELMYNGIIEIMDLQFNLWVYDSVDFKTPDVADGLCVYYVNSQEPVYPKRTTGSADQVLVENERYSVVVTSVTMDEERVELQVHLQNFSEKELLFIAPYATVNEQIADPLWAYNVSAGKQRNTKITFTAAQLQEMGVEELTELMLAIQIGDHQDWSAGAYFYKVFPIRLAEEAVEEEITEETTEDVTEETVAVETTA